MEVAQLDGARACFSLHISVAGLFGVDAAGASIHREAAVQAGGVNAARAGAQLGVLADAVVGDFAGAGGRIR